MGRLYPLDPSSRRPAAGLAWQGMTGSHMKMMRDETGQYRGNEHHECVLPSPGRGRGVTAISSRPLPTTGEGRRPWSQQKGRPVGGPDALAHVRLRQEGKPGAVPMALMRARGIDHSAGDSI